MAQLVRYTTRDTDAVLDLIRWAYNICTARHPDGGMAHEARLNYENIKLGRDILKRLEYPEVYRDEHA